MDATYKTTKYELPLFFISVRTNVGYSPCAQFITRNETAQDIQEALEALKTWNPSWKPKFFMLDYSEAEIAAIENAFPGIQTYLCDFHREQCWERWVRDQNMKSHLRMERSYWNCSVPAHMLHLQLKKESDLFKENPHIRYWLLNTWLTNHRYVNMVAWKQL